jgi:hypothetical protein
MGMDEDFLSKFREAPRPEFAKTLWEKLQRRATSELTPGRSRPGLPIPVLVTVSLLLLLAVLLSFPSVRAAAQQFLDLFRVQRFVAISVDPARLEQLKQLKEGTVDVEALLSRDTQVLKKPGEPQVIDNTVAAGEIAGIHVSVPTALPEGMNLAQIRVQGEAAARFTADTVKLRQLLDLLDIRDIQVPEQLNGTTVTVHVPPAVIMKYTKGNVSVTLMQSHSPEITLPLGVDLSQIVEIGLRIAGLAPGEAQQFAYSIDWHSTLLVPVPANAASFREVDVRGTPGLLIETDGKSGPAPQSRSELPPGSLLLWSGGDMVYALAGGIRSLELVQIANSLQ